MLSTIFRPFSQEDVKAAPEIVEYDYESACEKGELRKMRGVLPGTGEGTWYMITVDDAEYYYACYDETPDKVELFEYAIVSGDYCLANGIFVGMTKSKIVQQYPAMAILDREENNLNEAAGHMGWNVASYPYSLMGMDENWEYPDQKNYYWADQFDCIMISDVEQPQDSLPLYMALMIKDDKVASITFYYPPAG